MKRVSGSCVVRLLSAIGLVAAVAMTVSAQSLGELAKKEEARRQAIKKPSKVLTNDSLRSIPTPAAPPPASVTPPPASSSPAAASTEKPKPEENRKAQETAWRQKMQGARDSLQRSQMFAEALQSRINGLTTDFTARDDPAQRAVIANDRDKALAELDRVKNDITKQTKAIEDLQQEARKAGVPPGWLR